MYNLSISDDNLSSYINKISQFPMLTKQEEGALLVKYLEKSDINAAHKLVTSHLRLVVSIAIKFRSYGLPIMDLVAEGNIGLMKAVKKFKQKKGTRLSTYAMWWIRAVIQDYILKYWSILKISSNVLQKKLFSSVESLKHKISSHDNNKKKLYNIDNHFQTLSLNEKIEKGGITELVDIIPGSTSDQEEIIISTEEKNRKSISFQKAFQKLNSREREIITKRKLVDKPTTLEQLSSQFAISSERVRQIEEHAIKKMKKYIFT